MDGGHPAKKGAFTCDLVIARYKEKLDWLPVYDKYNFSKIIVYNKGNNDRKCDLKGKQCKQYELKNEGRCDHTYLYHIINNYDTLADVTIFSKGSSHMSRERRKLNFTVAKVFETQDSAFSVAHEHVPVHIAQAMFALDAYRSSDTQNHNGILDIETMIMKPSNPRPFGKWYEKHFPGISITKSVYAGIFAVSKRHIHQHTRDYYANLMKELEGHPNPEVGHYFERAWLAVFHPIPDECTYHEVIHEAMNDARHQVGHGPPMMPMPPMPPMPPRMPPITSMMPMLPMPVVKGGRRHTMRKIRRKTSKRQKRRHRR